MLQPLLDLLFPKLCYACLVPLGTHEYAICTDCRHDLPVTNFHLNDDPAVIKKFYGRVPIEQGTTLFRFEKKSGVQQLIHGLKYRGFQEVGKVLGDWFGGELKTRACYRDVEVVIPVPLHKKKQRQRGYNQVTLFAQQIAQSLDAVYDDQVLIKRIHTKPQAKKKRAARLRKQQNVYALKNSHRIRHKHILLVDDVITTGGTMEDCISTLYQVQDIRISIAAIALTE